MTEWRSLDEIVDAFSLSKPNSFPLARSELIKKLPEIHPDKHSDSGGFGSNEDEEQYHRIMSAIRCIDEAQKRSAKNLPSTEVALNGRALDLVRRDQIRAAEAKISVDIKGAVRSKYAKDKIGFAVMAAAVVGVLSYSQNLIGHPLIAKLLAYLDTISPIIQPLIGAALLAALLIALATCGSAWKREQRAKLSAARLLTDDGISTLFGSHALKETISATGEFSSKDMLKAFRSDGELTYRWFYNFLPPIISKRFPFSWTPYYSHNIFAEDPVLAQQALDLILEKLEVRGAVSRKLYGSIVETYQLSEAAKQQIAEPLFGL